MPGPFGLRHRPRQTTLEARILPSPRPPGGDSFWPGRLSPGGWPRPATLTSAGGDRRVPGSRRLSRISRGSLSGRSAPWTIRHAASPGSAHSTARRPLVRSKPLPINNAASSPSISTGRRPLQRACPQRSPSSECPAPLDPPLPPSHQTPDHPRLGRFRRNLSSPSLRFYFICIYDVGRGTDSGEAGDAIGQTIRFPK